MIKNEDLKFNFFVICTKQILLTISTLEIKKELYQIIDNSDTNLAEEFYNLIATYLSKYENSKMMQNLKKTLNQEIFIVKMM